MKGYKAFDENLKCRNLSYKVGKTTTVKGELKICENGIHFCEKLNSVFNYYPKHETTRVCEVEAVGEVKTEGDKSVTLSLKIIRELTKEEIKQATDGFKFNSGHYNSGHYNSGYYNSGNSNSGHYNSGYYNSGYYNSGHYNSGHYNSGNYNSGNYNSGNSNSGHYNSGYYNSGHYNSGNSNSGHYNSGYYNSGHYNSGNYNSGYYNSGMFNTTEPNARLFNRECDKKMSELPSLSFISREWKQHLVYVNSSAMTEQEKKDHPYHETTGGFIRKDTEYSYKKSWERVWSKITEKEKQVIQNLPNFCPKIFLEITGIDLCCEVKVTVNGVEKYIKKEDAKKLGLI